MTRVEVKNIIQNYVNGFGLGISKENLAEKVYFRALRPIVGDSAFVLNDLYPGVELERETFIFQLIKSKKNGCWIVKDYC